jgi:glycosyltransferase involved in cell wall biosynthesis
MNTATADPVVSIVMPTHNRADYIGAAIASVLEQTYADWELVIVDDGSTDDTREVVAQFLPRDPRIRYVQEEENRGIALSRNNGVARSRGRYIAMLDSDDAWGSPDKLALQVAALDADPQLDIVGTWLEYIDEKGERTGARLSHPTDDASIRAIQIHRNCFAQSSVMFRKDAFERAGGYDPHFVVADDHDLWLRMGRSRRFATLPRYDLLYRKHAGNITQTRRVKAARESLEVLRRHRAYYPGFLFGYVKGVLRLSLAFVR